MIRAEGLGKSYMIGHQTAPRERYVALRDVISRSIKGFGRSALDMARGRQIIAGDEVEEFWALKDVSFEVKRGEVVGIIGRNGAGKSTLLKILSRITEPSTGRVEIKGRVASLLEVGTGFHPELTGRENIYLNGAILGMSRAEIRRKFDEIVDFAGVEKFLDTPVKRYSSGMYVRLAFAVAAHLEPEILIVDEVLAVGDVEFQKKCLGKMHDVAGHGRTILFVSHNIGAILGFCESIAILDGGVLQNFSSDVAGSVANYLANSENNHEWINIERKSNNEYIIPLNLSISKNSISEDISERAVFSDEPIEINIEFECKKPDEALTIGIAVYDQSEQMLFLSYPTDKGVGFFSKNSQKSHRFSTVIPPNILNFGKHKIELIAGLHHQQWFYAPGSGDISITFGVIPAPNRPSYWLNRRPGVIAPVLEWTTHEGP